MNAALTVIALLCAGLAAVIVLWFLAVRPAPDLRVKLLLLVGIAVLPIGAALSTNVVGYQTTQQRTFCASCHLMLPYTDDSADPTSPTLASRHARNALFGANNCYGCHADYEMYGTVATKINGLHHVWAYYVEDKRSLSLAESLGRIHLYEPFSNRTCMECHSTLTSGFEAKADHRGLDAELRADTVSCASAGCHGPSHPFSKLGGAHGSR